MEQKTDSNNNAPEATSRLQELTEKAERNGLAKFSTRELIDFGRVYRRAASLLSRVKTQGIGGRDTENLNKIVARAYVQIYRAPSVKKFSLLNFLLIEFPRSFRANFKFILFAAAVFLLSMLLGYILTHHSAEMPDILLGPGYTDELADLAARHMGERNWLPEEHRPIASSMIMTNNIKVAFLAFSSGVLFGLGTLYVLCFNGLLLGVVGAVVQQHNAALNFWGFVMPHGVIELTAIMIAGGAGLKIGYALINPGKYGRGDALKLAAQESVPLILGIICMLFIAGIIEAFISPVVEIPSILKLLFSGLIAVTLFLYFNSSGR